MPISADKRTEIIQLLEQGNSNAAVAEMTGVPRGSVSAIAAHITMGTYSRAAQTQEASDEVLDSIETTFGLERDLQKELRARIEQLEEGLRIADGGKEKIVPSGRIDILATDKVKNRVVVELKAGTADRDAVGQILSYIGDLRTDGDTPVRGILVAGDFTARAISASKAVPTLQLRKYSITFSFQNV